MNILVLGGTQFIGRTLVEELLHAGHSVSIFNRGRTVDALPAEIERLRGDRDDGASGLAALTGREWDACVDVSGYTAPQVRSSTEALRGSVGHYVFVSAVSAYGDPEHGPVDESHPRSPPAEESVVEITSETYGSLKVTCEDIVQELFAERCALLRPQVVVGQHDPFDRYSYWVRRATQGGEMLAPGDGSDHVQVIDVRDVARFMRTACEHALSGSFNLAGPRLTWDDFITTLGARDVVWVPADVIAAAGVVERELPLYRPNGGPRSSLMHVSNARAVEAGLTLTSPADTARHVAEWIPDCEHEPAFSREREAELIRRSRSG
ncbi:MAG: NAD-dependent epimerase/dehydratase family protein [Acidobacteriota bacterium]